MIANDRVVALRQGIFFKDNCFSAFLTDAFFWEVLAFISFHFPHFFWVKSDSINYKIDTYSHKNKYSRSNRFDLVLKWVILNFN